VENLEKKKPSALTAIANAKNMNTQSPYSKLMTWVKQSLMEKELANYIQALRSDEELLRQWYEPFAFFRDERSSILIGLLTALNSIEFNIFLKSEEKDTPPPQYNMSSYVHGEMPGYASPLSIFSQQR